MAEKITYIDCGVLYGDKMLFLPERDSELNMNTFKQLTETETPAMKTNYREYGTWPKRYEICNETINLTVNDAKLN